MKWLALCGLVGAGALGVLWYAKGQPRMSVQPTAVRLASATLSLVLLIAAAYVAHYLGIYSLPLVIVAFVAIAVPARGLLSGTRNARANHALNNPAPAGGAWRARLFLPLLVVLVVAIAVLGVAVGTIVGPH